MAALPSKKQARTLLDPVVTLHRGLSMFGGKPSDTAFQHSIHLVPKLLKKEVHLVFPDCFSGTSDLLCIATFQKSAADLIDYSDHAAFEKDRLLDSFYTWALVFCKLLKRKGFWADFVDPMTGHPGLGGQSSAVYNEIDGLQMILKYKSQNVGVCSVIFHPDWGSYVYPASIFCDAPLVAVLHDFFDSDSIVEEALAVIASCNNPQNGGWPGFFSIQDLNASDTSNEKDENKRTLLDSILVPDELPQQKSLRLKGKKISEERYKESSEDNSKLSKKMQT